MADEQDDATIDRFEHERELAHRRYHSALNALDAAAAELPPTLTAALTAADAELARLNRVWNAYLPVAGDRSPGALLRRAMAELARLLPWRRRALHGALLAAINRQADAHRAIIDAVRHFQSHVIWYAQTVEGLWAGAPTHLVTPRAVEALQAAVSALARDWQLQWDSLDAREARATARADALTRAYDEAREAAALAQQSVLSLRRMVEAWPTRAPQSVPAAAGPPSSAVPEALAAGTAASTYVAFEDRYRGSRDDIRGRLERYAALFEGATNVLEVGCGRGELLELFLERGIAVRGIDLNPDMAAACRDRGLDADHADALAYLASQPDASLGGLIAIQVVEHLEPPYLLRFLDAAYRTLAPGAPLVVETINAACWAAFFDSFIRDFTHARPLHPDTLRYLVQAAGFLSATIEFRSPFSVEERLPGVRLPSIPLRGESAAAIEDLVEAVNAHAEILNARLFTHRDYAVIARR